MDYDPLEEQNSAPSQLQISILTDIKAEELLDDQEMRTRNIDEKKCKFTVIKLNNVSFMEADFTDLNVCRFCLTEHDPNEMIRIAWDEWQNDPLAKLYKIVTNCNVTRIVQINLRLLCMIKSRYYFSAIRSVILFGIVLSGVLQHDISAEFCNRTLSKVRYFLAISIRSGLS